MAKVIKYFLIFFEYFSQHSILKKFNIIFGRCEIHPPQTFPGQFSILNTQRNIYKGLKSVNYVEMEKPKLSEKLLFILLPNLTYLSQKIRDHILKSKIITL